MADAKKQNEVLKIKGTDSITYTGTSSASIFEKGTTNFKKIRSGTTVTVKGDADEPVDVFVQSVRVASLIELIIELGNENYLVAGSPYSVLSLVDKLTAIDGGAVLDVTELYTCYRVSVPMPVLAPAQTGAIAASR